MIELTRDELLAAITAACRPGRPSQPDDPGLTCAELAEAWGRTDRETRARLARAIREGTVLRGTRFVQNVIGSWRRVPVYRPRLLDPKTNPVVEGIPHGDSRG
jgi:hypothetical protein